MSPRRTRQAPPRSVLVTGAADPIGERLVRLLLEDSRVRHVLAVSSLPPEQLPFGDDPRLTCIQANLSRARHVRNMLYGPARDLGIDCVVHTSVFRSALNEGIGVHAFNVESTRSIIQLSERHPTIKRLVLRSDCCVYQVQRDLPTLIEEEHPLNMNGTAPQWVRDRIESDITACTRMGLAPIEIVVLRMAEALGPGTGSQLFDYLDSPVCLRPAGYDPMINLLTVTDAASALQKAIHSDAQGVFNIPGADTLPLSQAIHRWGRVAIPIPGVALNRLYRWRQVFTGHEFRYGMNKRRFHFSGVLDGTRARDVLGYVPCHPISWPVEPE